MSRCRLVLRLKPKLKIQLSWLLLEIAHELILYVRPVQVLQGNYWHQSLGLYIAQGIMPLLNIPSQCSLEHQFKVAFTAHQNFGLRISHSLEIGGLMPCLLAPIILGFWGSSCLMGMPWWMTWWGLICLISQFLQTWQAVQWLLLQYDGVMFDCFGQCYSFQWEFALRPLFLKERQKKSSIETMLSCNGVRQVHTLNGTKTLIQKTTTLTWFSFTQTCPFSFFLGN